MTVSVTDPDEQLRELFGERLYAAARELFDCGCVADVRILQAGRVLTGVVTDAERSGDRGARQRVYIQRPHAARFDSLEGECSCGASGPCVHVAAVSIAATQPAAGSPIDLRRGSAVSPQRVGHIAPGRQQHLYYLFEECSSGDGASESLQVSLWIGQTLASSGQIDSGSVCPFALRASDKSDEFPRYVDPQDREILKLLVRLRSNGPWPLHGEPGAEVLKLAATTGRAFWRSLYGPPLQAGRTRRGAFAWEAMRSGEQRLRGEISASVHIALNLEPALYVDANANVWGLLQAPYPIDLLRHYANRPPVAPELAAAVNEQLDQTYGAAGFPKLRVLSIRTQALSSITPRLVVSAGPAANLHFIYNGLDVDSRSLRPGQAARRLSDEPGSDVCWEIERDHDAEQRLHAQLLQVLPGAGQNRDAWLAFMMNGAPALQAQGWSVIVENGFPYRIASGDDWYADVSTAASDSWFDLRLGVTIDGKQINLLPALVSYLQGGLEHNGASHTRIDDHLLVQLEDGRYLPVALDRIERIAHTLVELHEQVSLSSEHALPIPRSQVSRVAQLSVELNSKQVRTDDPSLRTLIQDLADFSGIAAVSPPPHFRATLRPYQQEGLGWLQFLRRYRLGGVLADDMGLGKTVQTIAHLVLEKAQGRLQGPSLIVAPVSVIGNWRQEFRKFAPELQVLTLHGDRRKELFSAVDRADVVITGYSLLQLDSEFLLSRDFLYLILDEAQTIKNPRAKVSQVARALRAQHRLCLTGTPMENHLGELWSLFDFLQPGLLGDEREFQRHYRTPIEKNADGKRAQALTRRIAPFILRRTKEAVARELPPKTQIVEPIVLEERQRDFYDGIRLAMHRRVQEVIQEQGLARSHITVLDALLKLRQSCCDPRLVRDDAETRSIPSAKLDWLRTVLPELVAEGRRILLFSQFTSMLRLIEATAAELSIPYFLLTGETRERTELVRRFQAGDAPLFLISLKAGGVGLNLTAADTVIHYDPWWNPAVESQATDRAYRIGQDQPVFVYKLVAQGTVEEKIMQLQAEKHALATQLYTQQASAPTQWSAADIENLFAP